MTAPRCIQPAQPKENAMQLVYEVMTRDVQSVSARDTVRRAAQMMDDLNVGALPVCDGDRLVGMVTDRDITVRATSAGLNPDDAVVEQVMSATVHSCFEDQPLEDVARQMADTQIRRVPVVSHDDARRLVGIVSLGDLATKASGGARRHVVEQVVEKVSFPSEPDLSPQGRTADADAAAGGSDTGTATGIAGSDVLGDRMNPDYEVSSTADPSDVVEVTPAQLVNRNAPGSTTLSNPTAGVMEGQDTPVVVVRREAGGDDTSSGESGAPAGTDATGVAGASGGTAGVAGSPGTGVGATQQG
jgi:CBS domain-containing protein